MEKYDVNVLVENSSINAESGKQLKELVEYINHPNFYVCWDTGHGNKAGKQKEGILALGKYIKAIHFNDNDGLADLHNLPFTGTLKVDETMRAFMEIGYDGYFTFECSCMKRPAPEWFERRSNGLENELWCPSYQLEITEQKFMYEIAKYILSHYGLYEE